MSSQVKVELGMIEHPEKGDPEEPPPLEVNTCYDGLKIRINYELLVMMMEHLTAREDHQAKQVDTGFDRWLHSQFLELVYNML